MHIVLVHLYRARVPSFFSRFPLFAASVHRGAVGQGTVTVVGGGGGRGDGREGGVFTVAGGVRIRRFGGVVCGGGRGSRRAAC